MINIKGFEIKPKKFEPPSKSFELPPKEIIDNFGVQEGLARVNELIEEKISDLLEEGEVISDDIAKDREKRMALIYALNTKFHEAKKNVAQTVITDVLEKAKIVLAGKNSTENTLHFLSHETENLRGLVWLALSEIPDILSFRYLEEKSSQKAPLSKGDSDVLMPFFVHDLKTLGNYIVPLIFKACLLVIADQQRTKANEGADVIIQSVQDVLYKGLRIEKQ